MKINTQFVGYKLNDKGAKPSITCYFVNVDKLALGKSNVKGYQTFECWSSVEYFEKRVNVPVSKLDDYINKTYPMLFGWDEKQHHFYISRIEFK